MFPDSFLRDSVTLTMAHQRADEMQRQLALIRLGRQVTSPETARRQFFRMFWVRKFLFRLSSRLAYKLVMTNEPESPVVSGGARNHVAP